MAVVDADIPRAAAPPGAGPLEAGLVLRHTGGMIRGHWRRIAAAAFVFFVPTATLHLAAEAVHDEYASSSGWGRYVLLTGFLLAVTFIRFLGEVVFAGFLDMAVGDSWFRHEDRTLREVLRDLPWVPLIIVDIVVVTAAVAGLALFVIPGVVVYTFWGLAGPVVVQERHRWRAGLRRTYQISRPHWVLVLMLVVIPLGFEHGLAHAVREWVDQWGALAIVAGEWFIAATMLGVIGVIDVALANELMARTPFTPKTAPPGHSTHSAHPTHPTR
jgi:hypothetical protein